jgi:conjugative transfer region protein (TIGR03750 family)
MVMASEVESEADVFRGCTSTELITIIVVSILFWAPLMATLGVVLLGSMMMGLGMVLVMTIITVFIGSSLVQWVKRDKPEGHYQLVIQRFLGKHRIRKSGFILHHGELSLGRSRGAE